MVAQFLGTAHETGLNEKTELHFDKQFCCFGPRERVGRAFAMPCVIHLGQNILTCERPVVGVDFCG